VATKPPKRKPENEQITQFKMDVAVLGLFYTQETIGDHMGVEKSNFSNYLNDGNTITDKFLEKFYTAWGEILREIYDKRMASYPTEPVPEVIANEGAQIYAAKDILIDTLQKDNDMLRNGFEKMIETNQKLAGNNEIVVKSNAKLASSNEKLVKAHLSIKNQRGERPDRGAGGIS
jgi:transcriptional regulator with XRE-family HTH domain